jgi:hypothetical protein
MRGGVFGAYPHPRLRAWFLMTQDGSGIAGATLTTVDLERAGDTAVEICRV